MEYVVDGPFVILSQEYMHAHLYIENITRIDPPPQTNLHGVTVTDKLGRWGWKLDFAIWRHLYAKFWLEMCQR